MRKYPQVLLLGNGLNRAYGGISWGNLLKEISRRDDLPLDELKSPMPLQAILVTNNDIKGALKKCEKSMYGSIETKEQEQALQKLLGIGFDHILTTNYSYELEMACRKDNKITSNYLKSISKHTSSAKKVEPKYLLHTYNECHYENICNKIWHIHGEARKPDSMILGHYYYATLLCKIKSEVDNKGNMYQRNQLEGMPNKINSWMDAFILGDVYVLGFGYELSEFDLWWLLNRKFNERASTGKVYYFEPKPAVLDEKIELLKVLGVKVIDCDITLPKDPGEDASEEEKDQYRKECNEAYGKFYQLALEKIETFASK